MSTSLFIIKPEAMCHHQDILYALDVRYHFELTRLRWCSNVSAADITAHYIEHKGKSFFPSLIDGFIGKDILVGIVIHVTKPNDTVELLRKASGPYDPLMPGTIRGDYGISPSLNGFHASATYSDAVRENLIWGVKLNVYT